MNRPVDHLVIQYTPNDSVYRDALWLREKYLRRPLGLQLSAEDLVNENQQLHFGLLDDDRLLGSVTFKILHQDRLKLRQMVICPQAQGLGLGTRLIGSAEQTLRTMGYAYVEMAARATARGFYEKLGYCAEGQVFQELGIAHLKMVKRL